MRIYPELTERAIYRTYLNKEYEKLKIEIKKIANSTHGKGFFDKIVLLRQKVDIVKKEIAIFNLIEEVIVMKNNYGNKYDIKHNKTLDMFFDIEAFKIKNHIKNDDEKILLKIIND